MNHHHFYFSRHVSREVTEVYWYTLFNSLALSLVFIFEPIYLYSIGFSLIQILWFYVQVYVWYLLLITFGAKFAGKFGLKHSIFTSNIFYVIYWIVLFLTKSHPILFFVAPVFFALQKSWFWPAYDTEFGINSKRGQRGRETGVLYALIQLSFIIGPFLGGFISETFGFLALFIGASMVMLFSVYPLFRSSEIYSRHSFNLRRLCEVFKKYKANFFGYWGYAEDLMVMSLWPVFMFIVIPDYLDVGLVATIATVIGTMLMLYIGKLTDKKEKRSLIFNSSVVYGVTWIFRFLAKDLVGIITFDSMTKAAKDVMTVPMCALTYEHAAEKDNDWAIAYSVFYEMSLSVGKIVTALLGIAILAATGNIFLVFALVGILTMFYGFLK